MKLSIGLLLFVAAGANAATSIQVSGSTDNADTCTIYRNGEQVAEAGSSFSVRVPIPTGECLAKTDAWTAKCRNVKGYGDASNVAHLKADACNREAGPGPVGPLPEVPASIAPSNLKIVANTVSCTAPAGLYSKFRLYRATAAGKKLTGSLKSWSKCGGIYESIRKGSYYVVGGIDASGKEKLSKAAIAE